MSTNLKATFNRIITDRAEGLMENTADFCALQAFGVATVEKRMGEYPVFKIADLYRNSLKHRAVGSTYAETSTDLEMKAFVCSDYGVEEPIADETIAEMGEGYKQNIADKLMVDAYRNYEQVVFETAFDAQNWATVLTGASATNLPNNQFAKFDSATDVTKVIRAIKDMVHKKCGRKPNKAVMTADVLDALLENAFVRDLLPVNTDQFIDTAFLQRAFGLDGIYVTDGIINKAGYGLDANMDNMYKATMLLYWDGGAGRNSITSPCAMKVIRLNYGDINSASGVGFYERRDDARDVDILRVKQRFTPVIQYKEAGALLTQCI